MYKKIAYLMFDNSKRKLWEFIFDKLLNKINIYNIENGNIIIGLNRKNTNRYISKIIKKIEENEVNSIAIANNVKIDKGILENHDINVLNGKGLIRNFILYIVSEIYVHKEKNIYDSDVYITIKSDKDIKIIYDLAEKFKSVNIVTDKIKRMNRLDYKLEKNENIIYSISSNRSSALKRADLIINMDFDNKLLNEFKINRKSIIINASNYQINVKSSFQGIFIENIKLDFKCSGNKNFDNNILYESYVYNLNYEEMKNKYIIDNCKVTHFIGTRGIIDFFEIKKHEYVVLQLM